MSIKDELARSLYTGFVDSAEISLAEYQPKLLINNSKRGQKVLTNIVSELNKCEEFFFSVAFVTNSGVASLINILQELEEKGVRGKIIASQYQNFTEPRALKRLIQLTNLEVRIVVENNFHAKGYIFRKNDNYTLIVGSSNLTQDALSYNKEWNIKVSSMDEGALLKETIDEFIYTFNNATVVDEAWIKEYEKIYERASIRALLNRNDILPEEEVGSQIALPQTYSQVELGTTTDAIHQDESSYHVMADPEAEKNNPVSSIHRIMPNKMQIEALFSLENLRNANKTRALLISATGTGKTYLSAFDVKKFNPNRFLFIVHRENIARAAMKSFQRVLGQNIRMGVLSGSRKDFEANFIFSNIQTISKDDIISRFNREHFDYIVIDEVHRSGASTYQKVLEYFKPKFLLGMSATPERMDGFDIFKAFDYNIAYEIRLNRALEENMLCPFHYYGITDVEINGELINEQTAFNFLVSDERVERIIEKAKLYGCDHGRVKGLIFCSRVEEARELSKAFNARGLKTVSLDGSSSEEEREAAILRLEQDENLDNCLDYILTVDIFNEGVDIPSINQIIMLRPTQSSIVFIQQLGRGLRKIFKKEYVVVIDFIGNYANNFMIPIALYGDNSYNKDTIRKLINTGNSIIPGCSTINFDLITRERIYKSIDTANMSQKKDLVKDYDLLKYKIGRVPMMMDLIEHGSRDPYQYVDYSKSYFNFVLEREEEYHNKLDSYETKLLELISSYIADGKRIEEVITLKKLLEEEAIAMNEIKGYCSDRYGFELKDTTIASSIRNLNFLFVTDKCDKKLVSVGHKLGLSIVELQDQSISLSCRVRKCIENPVFREFLVDILNYAEYTYNLSFNTSKYIDGFILYKKYSRRDVFRILCWDENPVAQNVGGYIISKDKSNCPIFINYHKEEDISSTIKYEDKFLNRYILQWMSKNKRTLASPDVQAIINYRGTMRMPLFIKKSNGEGDDFYYMGDVEPIIDRFQELKMSDDNGKEVPVVKMELLLKHPVEEGLYRYITNN